MLVTFIKQTFRFSQHYYLFRNLESPLERCSKMLMRHFTILHIHTTLLWFLFISTLSISIYTQISVTIHVVGYISPSGQMRIWKWLREFLPICILALILKFIPFPMGAGPYETCKDGSTPSLSHTHTTARFHPPNSQHTHKGHTIPLNANLHQVQLLFIQAIDIGYQYSNLHMLFGHSIFLHSYERSDQTWDKKMSNVL